MLNTKKTSLALILFATICIANNYLLSMEDKQEIIENSSYYLHSSNESAGNITFYKYNGDEIITKKFEYHLYNTAENFLDPNASKPQPTSAKLKFQAGWPIPIRIFGFTIFTLMKNPEMWYIIFSDKNGMQINDEYIYNREKEKGTIKVFSPPSSTKYYIFDESNPNIIDDDFPLDLSKIYQVEYDG